MTHLPVTQFFISPKVNTAEYPGANNELLIKSVVIPLERAINGVPGMKYIASDAVMTGSFTSNI
jgi:HAE1 family hydrophobic/amphiphilic exporter-1